MIDVFCYIDSAHGVYSVDRRSQVGIVVQLGDSTVYARSAKLRSNTKSSAESELIGISNEVSQGIWHWKSVRTSFLKKNRFSTRPYKIFGR